jgi:hypothetical protein
MTAMAGTLFVSLLGRLCAPLRFTRIALSHATWPLISIAALLGSARVMAILMSGWIRGDIEPVTILYRFVPSEITAACMLIAVLIAEQSVRNGSGRLTAYVPAVLIAAALAGLLSTPLILLMRDQGLPMVQTHRGVGAIGIALYYSTDALARGGLAAWIFAKREGFLGSLNRLRVAELESAHTERDLANARLAATEAMMQPEALIFALNAVRALYDQDRAAADDRLAGFIDHLRSVSMQSRP